MLLDKLSIWIGKKILAIYSYVKPHVIAQLKKGVERYLRLRNKIQRTTRLQYYRDDDVTEINSLNDQVDFIESSNKSTHQPECLLSSNDSVEEDHLHTHEQGYHQPDKLVQVEEDKQHQ